MPESVRDRLNCRYELIFLLVKQAAYWFDLDPIRIKPASTRSAPFRPPGRNDPARPGKYGPHTWQVTDARRYGPGRARRVHPNGRNPGDVWAIPHPPLCRAALRRVPPRPALALDPSRVQAGRHRPGPVRRVGHHRPGGPPGRPRLAGIELSPAFAALAAERLSQTTRPGHEDGQP